MSSQTLASRSNKTERGWLLVSDRFEALNGSGDVHALASKIAVAIELAGHGNPAIKFEVGSLILEQQSTGSVVEHRSAKIVGVAAMAMVGTLGVRIEPSATLSESEKEQARNRQLKREHRQRAERISQRARAAFKSETARKIQSLLTAPELDTTTMNAVVELITADMGPDRKQLDYEKQFTRFGRSINH